MTWPQVGPPDSPVRHALFPMPLSAPPACTERIRRRVRVRENQEHMP
jgi:hypothetical protein